jgi:acidic leucine-rich nuclear phosphoprotein 32 family protein A/C/D
MYNGLDNLIACKSITHLNLSGNKIKDAEELAPLAHLTSLRNLDLFNCEVTKIDGYREKIFKLLPSLKFLDGFDQNEQEDEEDDEECK